MTGPEFVDGTMPEGTCEVVTLAVIVRHDYQERHVLTHAGRPLQLVQFRWEPGHAVPLHEHVPQPRTITETLEVLIVRRGKVLLGLLDRVTGHVVYRTLHEGDTALLLAPHSVEVLEEAVVLEVKQGPYQPHDKRPIERRDARAGL